MREKRTDKDRAQEMDVTIWYSRHCRPWLLRIRILAMDFTVLADAIRDRLVFCIIAEFFALPIRLTALQDR